MGILTRYLARSHVGPFLFALGALTGLLFLNAVAQRLNLLVGKGLGWGIIGEFLLLSLPHTVALTLPMAVLIAVLYTFADLTGASEVTAMRAGGVPPSRLLVPMLVLGGIAGLTTYYFNDQILPEANHRLKTLMIDIANKSPTFELRDQVVNAIETTELGTVSYYLQATEIDQATNGLRDVTIFDVTDPRRHRTIYADRGEMAFNEARTDLYLTLHEGVVFETDEDRPGSLMRTGFATQVIPLRGVGDLLEREDEQTSRSDREMSVSMLMAEAANYRAQQVDASEEAREESLTAVRKALGLPLDADSLLPQDTARADAAITQAAFLQEEIPDDGMTRGTTVSIRTSKARWEIARDNRSRYWVEIHKKFAISTACLVFVLLGVPFAIRFPRGGVGMVISASVGIFGVYWTGLIGGENLADRGLVSPFWAMWGPNLIFGFFAVILVRRMGRETASMRGGGWDDLLHSLKGWLRHPFGGRERTA
ncbi:MAG: LptF/LptG family permease [Gemmatimonadota bacterium]